MCKKITYERVYKGIKLDKHILSPFKTEKPTHDFAWLVCVNCWDATVSLLQKTQMKRLQNVVISAVINFL